MNMKNFGRCNVRKHKKIKVSDKYVTLDISLKFDSLDNMQITSSESKERLKRSGKGLITYLGFKTKARSHKYKKPRYAIGNFSKKDLSKIIREFDKFERLTSDNKRPKHEPYYRYFYLARYLVKCMMRSDTLNWHNYGSYTEMTAPSSNVYSTDEDESKSFIVHETFSQNYSEDVDGLCYTYIGIPEYTIT